MRQILAALTLGTALALSASAAFAGDSGLHSFQPANSTSVVPVDTASVIQVSTPNTAMAAGSNQAAPWIVELRGENFDHR